MASGKPFGMEFSCANSMEIRRIEAGILDNLTDMDMSTTPFEVGLSAYIDMDKEGFVGRAALLSADPRSLFYGVKCSDVTPVMNWLVLEGGQPVGRITAGAWSPYLECGVGYVRFYEPDEWCGRTLQLDVPGNNHCTCEIVDLPFYDTEKRIARGLDTTIP